MNGEEDVCYHVNKLFTYALIRLKGRIGEMSDNKMYMDTNVFTGIVGDIKGSASWCKLQDDGLLDNEAWEGTGVGRYMNTILKQVYKTSHLYMAESAEALPTAFFKMRDSIIKVDDVASKSIVVNEDKSGGTII